MTRPGQLYALNGLSGNPAMALTAWLSKPDAGSASSDQLTAYRTLGAAKTSNITGLSQPRSGCVEGRTDANGRCAPLVNGGAALAAGNYRLVFDTKTYFAAQKVDGLYPLVQVQFTVRAGEEHFHIPLLLSPNGYTTYRGS